MAREKRTRGGASPESHQQEAFWESYPELLGLVLSHLPDEERCKVIPLVSRTWLNIHKDYPPRRISWDIQCSKLMSQPMVSWFLKIAGTLEKLSVDTPWQKTGFLAQMVCLAATYAPNLTTVTLDGVGGHQPVLHSLALLSQIRKLALDNWSFPQDPDDTVGICGLSGLRSLQASTIFAYTRDSRADARGIKLAYQLLSKSSRLPRLNFVRLDAAGRCNLVDGSPQFLFWSLTKMTKIRALSIRYYPDTLDWDSQLCPAFASLTQLKELDFKYYVLDEEYAPVLSLPLLENLRLDFCSEEPISNIYVASPYLTALEVVGSFAPSVADYLPLHTPCLACLHTLRIPDGDISEFPDALASRLRSLVDLDLQGNSFERLPGALAYITTLQSLDLSENPLLQLADYEGNAAVIRALSSLVTLKLKKCSSWSCWTTESVQAIQHLKLRFPNIEIES